MKTPCPPPSALRLEWVFGLAYCGLLQVANSLASPALVPFLRGLHWLLMNSTLSPSCGAQGPDPFDCLTDPLPGRVQQLLASCPTFSNARQPSEVHTPHTAPAASARGPAFVFRSPYLRPLLTLALTGSLCEFCLSPQRECRDSADSQRCRCCHHLTKLGRKHIPGAGGVAQWKACLLCKREEFHPPAFV